MKAPSRFHNAVLCSSLALALALGVAALAPAPARGTSYVPMADEDLADQTPLIVRGRVVGIDDGPFGAMPSTDYTVEVDRVLKGFAPGSTLIVRVPGGRGPDGRSLHVWGAPRFGGGERPLLFLEARRDGTFGIVHLMLGAFHVARDGSREVAVRRLAEAHALVAPGGRSPIEPVRHLRAFETWLEDRAAGLRREADYLVAGADPFEAEANAEAEVERLAASEFTYIQGFHVRWNHFDQGRSVTWRAQATGQPQLAGGGFAEFQQALAAWNADPGTNIAYVYGGTTGVTNGLAQFDALNTILFEDPNNEASGTFGCPGGGVLAVGGPWFDDEAPPPHPIAAADIVVNDGAGCWFQTDPRRAAEVYAHELGHTLGLGHSCGDERSGDCDTPAKSQALMRAQAKALSAGAVLGDDDRAGIASLYAGGAGAPADLRALEIGRNAVTLAWDDIEGETQYLIESRKLPSGKFRQAAVNRRNRTTKAIGGLRPRTTYEFRVRAKVGKSFTAYSAVLTVRTAD